MNFIRMGIAGAGLFVLTACSSPQGGVVDDPYGYGPAASPTMRPGMHSQDIRDPNALTRPGIDSPNPVLPASPIGVTPSSNLGATP